MNLKTKIKIAQVKLSIKQAYSNFQIKCRKTWNQVKDLILVIMLLNLLITQLQGLDPAIFWGSGASKFQSKIVIKNDQVAKVQAKETTIEDIPTPEKIIGEFSAYSPSPDQTDSDPLTMASGKKVYSGAIACPSKYSFGTKISIEGMGTYTCEDRMNLRYRDKENFDIYFPSYDEALSFGRKKMTYHVL